MSLRCSRRAFTLLEILLAGALAGLALGLAAAGWRALQRQMERAARDRSTEAVLALTECACEEIGADCVAEQLARGTAAVFWLEVSASVAVPGDHPLRWWWADQTPPVDVEPSHRGELYRVLLEPTGEIGPQDAAVVFVVSVQGPSLAPPGADRSAAQAQLAGEETWLTFPWALLR